MRIRSSIGLGIFLLVLSVAMPTVFSAFESLLLSLVHTAQSTVERAESFTASPSFLVVPSVSSYGN